MHIVSILYKTQAQVATGDNHVECLHQLKEGKHHKHKVQRSGCKVQRSGHKVQRLGPASALVSMGCSNNMQLQPPPPPTIGKFCVLVIVPACCACL